MKFLNTFLLVTLSVQFAGAEIFDSKSLVNRYRTTSEEALRTQESIGAGEAVAGTTGLGLLGVGKAISNANRAIVIARELTPLTDAINLMSNIATQRKTYDEFSKKAIDEADPIAVASRDEILKDLADKIEVNEAKLTQLRTSRTYTTQLDDLEEALLKGENVKIDEFLEQAKTLTKDEKALVARLNRSGKGRLTKVIIAGVSLYVLADGATRYLIAAKAERDPTIFPMAGVFSWVAGESGEAAVAAKDGSVEFVTKTVPEKVSQAHKAVVNKYNSLRGDVDQEMEKVEESLRDPSSDKN